MRIQTALIFWLVCLLFPHRVGAQELPFTHYTSDREMNPLPSSGVNTVYQDKQGYIWMATTGAGLARYDGHRMEQFGLEDGLADLSLTGIMESSSGKLWLASVGGLVVSEKPLAAYKHGKRPHFTAHPGVPLHPHYINKNCLAADRQHGVWIGTDTDGIIRYRENKNGTVAVDTFSTDIQGRGQNETVYSLAVRRDGTVWAGLAGGLLLAFDTTRSRFAQVRYEGDSLDESIMSLFESRTGELWGGSYSGTLWRLIMQNNRYRAEVIGRQLGEWISSITETREGKLWVASRGAGLLRLDPTDPNKQQIFTRRNGLLSEILADIAVDREGNLWIAHDLGLSKLRRFYAAFRHFTANSHTGEPPVLPAPSVRSVIPPDVRMPCLWAATESGVACIQPGGESLIIDRKGGLEGSEAYDLLEDQEGRIWIGLSGFTSVIHPAGMPFTFIGDHLDRDMTLFGEPWNISSFDLSYVYVMKRFPMRVSEKATETTEALWFLSYLKVACYVDGEWFFFRQKAGYPATSSGAAAVDDQGRIWIGTDDQGLFRSKHPVTLGTLRRELRLSNESPRTEQAPSESQQKRLITSTIFEPVWNRDTGSPTNNIQSLFWHEGVLWIGTPNGLYLFRSGSPAAATHLHKANRLPTNHITAIAFSSATGTVWLGTDEGLIEIDPAKQAVIRNVTRQDGLLDNEIAFQASLKIGHDGTIYFGTPRGLSVYHPSLHKTSTFAPTPQIRRIHFTEDAWGNNEFELEYAALVFTKERSVRYRNRLLGYQDRWSEEKADAAVRFTNLRAFLVPRRYVLEVTAGNGDGKWSSDPLRYAIWVQPPWWLRWWAFAGYLTLFGMGAFAAYRTQQTILIKKERAKSFLREKALRAQAAEAWANYLQSENQRQTLELEQARALQLSMLPDKVPDHPVASIAAFMKTATEVGGDYYDFHLAEDETLTLAIGDATGHGTQAGTMVTAMKSLFVNYAEEPDPAAVLSKASHTLRRMNLSKLYMAFALVKVRGRSLELAGAGMPPAFLYRYESGLIEQIPLKGVPLGGPAWPYHSSSIELNSGDTLLLMSDGFPELRGKGGAMISYEHTYAIFREVADQTPEAIIEHFKTHAEDWINGQQQNDDITFIALKVK